MRKVYEPVTIHGQSKIRGVVLHILIINRYRQRKVETLIQDT